MQLSLLQACLAPRLLLMDIRADSSDPDTSGGVCELEPDGGNHFGGSPLGGKTYGSLYCWLRCCFGWGFVCQLAKKDQARMSFPGRMSGFHC